MTVLMVLAKYVVLSMMRHMIPLFSHSILPFVVANIYLWKVKSHQISYVGNKDRQTEPNAGA